MKTNTFLLHGYPTIDEETGASSLPIYQTSTFHQKSLNPSGNQFTYTRFGNPTVEALEKAIAGLEKAEYGFAFSSGMAAINSAILSIVKANDHIVLSKDVYGGAYQLLEEVLLPLGIRLSFVDGTNPSEWEGAVTEQTKLFYLETPSNPLLAITDIQKISEIAKKYGIKTLADNTFMTPLLQQPLSLGMDVVVHSGTKFLNGHSDVTAGFVVTNDSLLAEKIHLLQKAQGGILSPHDAWLVLRGLKTLGLRMKASCDNAQQMAQLLKEQANVLEVYYPGLLNHPYHFVHQNQATHGGAVLSFKLKNQEAALKFFNHIQLPIVAVSLGGVESILSYPCQMSHASVPKETRESQGINCGLIRFSLGIEDFDDLKKDIIQALTFI